MKEQTEVNLDSLIKRLQAEGIKRAEALAEGIISKAEERASLILKQAEQEAEGMMETAKDEIARTESTFRKNLEQAARDVMIGVKRSIMDTFYALLQQECKVILSETTTFETLFLAIVDGLNKGKEDAGEFEIWVSNEDRDAIFSFLLTAFKDKMKTGIDVKAKPDIGAGFKIGVKDEHIYYDLTDEGIAALISAYITPGLETLLADVGMKKKKPGDHK
ncbi:hypothetical protein [Desulfobacter vibrioformis]|uniref:hypothetical protein n=1 Tax=Desulfobacter vibrioformis TaxID=34031 RepID=UPI00068C748F|nr:hypothetical protein [Desulfobacter vibrioformis]